MTETSPSVATPEDFLPPAPGPPVASVIPGAGTSLAGAAFPEDSIGQILNFVAAKGFVVEPWQVAAYVNAIRTKPLVTLAGISGTGKSSIPRLVAAATNARYIEVPVNPDWTDSGDIIGHSTLSGDFVPGSLLQAAYAATLDSDTQYFFMLDEINLSRIEYYLAEVLSVIETRERTSGGLRTESLARFATGNADNVTPWSSICLPPNLAIVGSVNMDETTYSLSRKVLDRSFILEYSSVDLSKIPTLGPTQVHRWDAGRWEQPYLNAAELSARGVSLEEAVTVLEAANEHLQPMQQHVGYRVRDEVAAFVENASNHIEYFIDSSGTAVDPLDLALLMKVLPRIHGSSTALETALKGLQAWAEGDNGAEREFPLCRARLQLMRDRLQHDGVASYWV